MLKTIYIRLTAFIFFSFLISPPTGFSQDKEEFKDKKKSKNISRTLYGQGSFYAAKFEGRKTATGEKFMHSKLTAACNVLPLGTWVKVTNLKNGKSIVVRTNDRLHPKTKRIIDLSKTGAQKLGYEKAGLARVKIEVLKKKPK